MSEQRILLAIMAVAVTISSVAMAAMAVMVFAMYRSMRALQARAEPAIDSARRLIHQAEQSVQDSRARIGEITVRAHGLFDSALVTAARLDEAVADTAHRTRVQLARLEMLAGGAMDGYENVGRKLQTIARPFRTARFAWIGLRAAVRALRR